MIDTTTFLFHGSSEISMNNYNTHTHAREITVVNFNVKQCLRCLHFDWLTEWMKNYCFVKVIISENYFIATVDSGMNSKLKM